MSMFSDYTEANVIGATLRGVPFPLPSAVYLALFTSNPNDAKTGNEVTTAAWPAYARQDAAAGGAISTGWAAPANGVTSNAKKLEFQPNNGASSVVVTHIGLLDAATGGNLLYHAPLASPKTIDPTDSMQLPIGSIVVTVD